MPNIILALVKAPWRRNLLFLVDEIVKRKASITQQDPGNVEDAMKENDMIPGGWNRQREGSDIEQYSGPVAGPLEEEMIYGG